MKVKSTDFPLGLRPIKAFKNDLLGKMMWGWVVLISTSA